MPGRAAWCSARKVEKEDGVGKVWVGKSKMVVIFVECVVQRKLMSMEGAHLESNMCCIVECMDMRRAWVRLEEGC
jgi:hypothetical protein